MDKKRIYNGIKNVFNVIIVVLLFMLSIKKGGFYKYDTLFFNLGILIIGTIYLILKLVKVYKINKLDNGNKKVKVDIISMLLFGLCIAYFLPILFKNYANLNDSIFEMVRYYCLFVIYNIVKNSNNKKIYIGTIIALTLVQCIIGIDGIANRYLAPYFSYFRTGYLSQDITRMSANIQYANVFAMLCLISLVLVIDKLLNNLNNNNKITNSIYFTFAFVFLSSIVLSSSRTVMLLASVALILLVFVNRKEKGKMMYLLGTYCIQLVLVSIYTTLVYKNMVINLSNIYTLFGISLVVSLIISYIFNCIYYSILNYANSRTNISNYASINVKTNCIIIFIILLFVVYIVVGLNLSKPIYISSTSKINSVTREIYNIQNNKENTISFKVRSEESDSRFKVTIYTVDNEFKSKVLKEFNYYDNTNWNFKFDFFVTEDVRNLKIDIKCDKGSISLDDFYINNKKQILNYTILPSVVVFRINDILHNSNSATDRVVYNKDAMKIITKTTANFLIGTGGEGFSHLYKTVQEVNYNSTEVHNSFLQIFVEAGVFGFICIISVIILGMFKGKNNVYKLVLLMLVLHSIVDLNFSYMIMISIFGILISLLDTNCYFSLDINIYKILLSICLIILVIVTVVVLSSNIALNIKIPQIDVDKTDPQYEEIKNEVINKYEMKIKLDPYDEEYKNKYENFISP